jgi:DNA-directed RNA polymerase subunit RPC12/RpoP
MGLLGKIFEQMMKSDDKEHECPICGGTLVYQNFGKSGIYTVTVYKCQACGNEVNKGMGD